MRASLGGTFSPIHKGHEKLLEWAFTVADEVLIGLTTDEFVEKQGVESYGNRKKNLEAFLGKKGWASRAEIVPILDKHGPSTSLEDLDAIIVSSETKKIAEEINDLRTKNGLKPLKILVISMVLAEDGKPISSERIRGKEIDNRGKLVN